VRYLETQLQALGLRPANGASYRQTVQLAGIRCEPARSALVFTGPSGSVRPAFGTEFVFGAAAPQAQVAVSAPLVFVGHGIFAGDGGRDDYKGFDAKGKVLVMLTGDRQDGVAAPLCCQPENYQGRWTYKFEEARRRGAAGVLLIHTTPSAGYGWAVVQNSWTGERFQLEGAGGEGTVQGWLSQSAAAQVFAAAGQDLARLMVQAQGRDFRPVPLDLRVQGEVRSQVRHLEQWNVAGILPGTDPRLKEELVIFSAHWDHFGIGAAPGSPSYNGAIDNASGCAGVLAIAQALAAHPTPRSLMFLFPCGEEQGLLGATAYMKAPLWPLARTVLDINLESLNFAGPTRDIGLLGPINPAVRALCQEAAAGLGLALTPAKADPAGLCFRSDHFPFAKAGVQALSPGFSLDGGWDYLGDAAQAQARAKAYLDRYHRPTDRYDPDWDLGGMMQQVQFCLELGRLAGTAPAAGQAR
jgi:Zn-dependent M28 family amino/carboxypeptidase